MTSTAAHRIRRGVVIAIGTVVILGLGVYGPATLLGPLPAATARVLDTPAITPAAAAPALPSTGASGVTVAGGSPAAATSGAAAGTPAAPGATAVPGTPATSGATAAPSTPATPGATTAPGTAATPSATAPPSAPPASAVTTAGIADPVPLGGTTKVITALVVLSAHPLAAGTPGDPVVITAEDYADYVRYISESSRAVSFITNESWSERDMLIAMLLGSSNNHADALARWAFGTTDAYVTAANAWLAANGMTGTTVTDTTGLSETSVGTASDLTRIAELAFETPVIAEIMALPSATVNGNRQVQNLAVYLPDLGITGLSLSYTDEAGLCLLYRATVPLAGAAGAAATTDATADATAPDATAPATAADATIYGAMLREPDYPTLEADLTALVGSASTGLKPTEIAAAQTPFVEYTAAWGQTARGVTSEAESRMLWATTPVTQTATPLTLTTAPSGAPAGTVTFALPEGAVDAPLTLDGPLTDPGPLWRLAHPFDVIGAFIASRG
ncbi:hypothetical protein B7R22_05100 [Subtercola boreus]|uniref:Peptidase S11 D-alanyl-D-alanine carboxypeptidase A N-terminal domain-containing protein n=1 Tax=Subtercola boreus TaxID=120213 RepID=A0A3E0W0S8_9MICO|nr:hypothetical protein [Subtercola boreus]RFA15984.1 hypothetical protein B7R22_05100 [Subtercola boreus]